MIVRASSRPANDERIGLVVAASLHALLIAWLAWHPPSVPVIPPPERMTVTLTDSVGLTATSPEPQAETAADVAPELGAPAPAAAPEAEPAKPVASKSIAKPEPLPPAPRPSPIAAKVEPPAPKPTAVAQTSPKATPSPAPRATTTPRVTPAPRPAPTPSPAPQTRPSAAARPIPAQTVPARTAATPAPRASAAPSATTQPSRPAQSANRVGSDFLKGVSPARSASPAARPASSPPGGSRLGDDFLKGVPGAQATGAARSPPAAAIGPAVQSALSGAISRELKPHWAAPQGADAELLVTILTWSLNCDGSLAGTPQVVRQEGITDANRPQASRHAEQAIRAVQLAAPFNLPAEYYDAWKRVGSFRFDRKLSQ